MFPSQNTHSITSSDFFPSERMVLPLWRSLHSLNLMLPKEDRRAMLLRLYNDDSPLMDHSKDRFLAKTNTESNANGEKVTVGKGEDESLKVDDDDGESLPIEDEDISAPGLGPGSLNNNGTEETGKISQDEAEVAVGLKDIDDVEVNVNEDI